MAHPREPGASEEIQVTSCTRDRGGRGTRMVGAGVQGLGILECSYVVSMPGSSARGCIGGRRLRRAAVLVQAKRLSTEKGCQFPENSRRAASLLVSGAAVD